jgi:protein SCO1
MAGLAAVGSALISPASLMAERQRKAAVAPGPRADYFPNFTLYNQHGKPVRFYDDLIRGRIVMVNMFYASCDGICPGMTTNLLKVQKLLGKRVGQDVFMYSITLKPEVDSPRVLREYASSYGTKPGWLFLTGQPNEVEILRRKLGFVDPNPAIDADVSQHTGMVWIGNERIDRWSGCPALADPEQIVKVVGWVDRPAARR